MKLLSIDVGMKNLAYCLLDVDISKNYLIDKWEIINLCKNKDMLCSCNTKKGKCISKAKYMKNGIYYCKTHAKQDNKFKIPIDKLKPNILKKQKLNELKNIANMLNLKLNKKVKKIECLELINNIYNEQYYQFYIPNKTTDYSMVDYGITIKNKLNDIFHDINIDIILIENQIGPLALRMKTLQGMIMQHFIENNMHNINEISASNKLKNFLGNKKTTYEQRKKQGIIITKDILNKNKPLHKCIDYFNSHKKKDDLADCFLQALWFINK